MRTILGISLGVDAGAALVRDGELVAAVNEERLSRQKFHMGFPHGAIRAVVDDPREVDLVAFGSTTYSPPTDVNEYSLDRFGLTEKILVALGALRLQKPLFGTDAGIALCRAAGSALMRMKLPRILHHLSSLGIHAPTTFVDHHTSHAASAAFTSGWDDALVVTADQMGDGFCSTAFAQHGCRLTPLKKVPIFHSFGIFYAYVTLMMGFKIGREGKIMGLAAHGDPTRTLDVFRRYASFSPRRGIIENHGRGLMCDYLPLKRDLARFSREDVAAGLQAHFEDSLAAFAKFYLVRTGRRRLALAGGVFANVKVNQRLRALADTWVFPNMGDGGLAAGAALHAWCARGGRPRRLPTLYLGPAFTARDNLREHEFSEVDDAAELLARGKVVARFHGRMEYGPRALGNRSILCTARDPSVNGWLNERLRRTEFMPFAPTVLEEDAHAMLVDYSPSQKDAANMTTAYRATKLCREIAPAVVHVDGTVRPQVLRAIDNPPFHRLLTEYRRLTGHGIVLNTSFNMHEEPIVCTPRDALRAFAAADLDVLFMDGLRIERADASVTCR